MSATDELRRLLDERGVEWTKPKSATEFMQTTFLCNGWGIEVLERNIGLCATATNIFDTPERAIAATLGSNGKSRYSELFGTPERAAWTLAGICERCEYGDCVTCGVPECVDYSHDYDALLEWLRGDA